GDHRAARGARRLCRAHGGGILPGPPPVRAGVPPLPRRHQRRTGRRHPAGPAVRAGRRHPGAELRPLRLGRAHALEARPAARRGAAAV
ncbi:MAG: hypothetical protein AVDCRST_MAG68-845, partial [uncultured Gemmatimonadetes bacterium]